MTWAVSSVVSPGGATQTTYTLNLPELGLEAAAVFTKINAAQSFSVNQLINSINRTASGETWGFDNAFRARPGGVLVTVFSGSGTPTFTGTKVKTLPVAATACMLRSSDFIDSARIPTGGVPTARGYTELRSIVKPPAETWANNNVCMAYVDGAGDIQYTNSIVTANSVGVLRYVLGDILCQDPSDSINWIVGIIWSTPDGQFTSCGEGVEPTIPRGSADFLGNPTFSNQEFTLATSSATAQRVVSGRIVSMTGSGASTLVGLRLLDGLEPSDLYASSVVTPQCGIRQAINPDAIASAGYFQWSWKTGSVWTGTDLEYNRLIVRIPAIVVLDNLYTINLVPVVSEFACDVTLPFPVGDARIVWTFGSTGAGGVPSGCGFMTPYLVRRTGPSSAPYTNAVRNDYVRPVSGLDYNRDAVYQFMPFGVAVSNQAWTVYGLLPLCEHSRHCHGREVFPTDNHTVNVGPVSDAASGGPSAVEASWAYWDCSSGTPAWTLVGSSAALAVVNTGISIAHWQGLLTPATFPADYPQGGLMVMIRSFVAGSWTAWTATESCHVPTANVPLPVYPFNTQIPPWLGSDADVTPVANAGWTDTENRDTGPTVTWVGSPTVGYAAGTLSVTASGATPSSAANKMFGAVSHVGGHSRVTADSGKLVFNGSNWYFCTHFPLALGAGGTNTFTMPNPSTLGSQTVQVDSIVRAAPAAGASAVFGDLTAFDPRFGPPGAIYHQQVIIP